MSDQTTRVGVLGGTFDPIHIGHLILLEEARNELTLDRIILMPAADPPHKQDRTISAVHHRFRMCELATLDADHISISRIDADRPGPHYSVDTVRLLKQQLPADAELYFLIGLDSLRDLPTWHAPEQLIRQCIVAAFSRAGVSIDWDTLETAIPGIQSRVRIIDMPELEISSSDLRQRISDGRPIRYQTPRLVEEYIRNMGLYQ